VNPAHLFLGSKAQNSADMVAKGRSAKGRKKPNAVLTEQLVRAIREAWPTLSEKEIADRLGVSYGAIRAVITRRSWAWLDYNPPHDLATIELKKKKKGVSIMPETTSVTRGEKWTRDQNPASRQPQGPAKDSEYTSDFYTTTAGFQRRDKNGVLREANEPFKYIRKMGVGDRCLHLIEFKEGTRMVISDAEWQASAPLGPSIGWDKPSPKREPNFAKFAASGPTELQESRDALAKRHLFAMGYATVAGQAAEPTEVASYLHSDGHAVTIHHERGGKWRATHVSKKGDIRHFSDTDALGHHLRDCHKQESFAVPMTGQPIAPGSNVFWLD
jgi:hypothetical protein